MKPHSCTERYKKNRVLKLLAAKYSAVTTEFWTSITCIPFMSFTVYFRDNNLTLQSYCLDAAPSNKDHTGGNIAIALPDVLETGNLSQKILWLPPLIMLQTKLLLSILWDEQVYCTAGKFGGAKFGKLTLSEHLVKESLAN